ncbi:hypothetical protein ACFW0H_00335 [Pseudomonas sp. CR3202]|uniref:hypothetical protein n=1 Tax=Pseudomonas sp. CR3202 TaxID=3351532 RepID=UPI003BF2B065
MAKTISVRSTSAATPRRTGLRGWVGRLRGTLDRLIFQLIRLPCASVDKGTEADKKKGRR